MTKLLIGAAAAAALAAPGIVGRKEHAMNREDYLHDVATNPRRYRRKDGPNTDEAVAEVQKSVRELSGAIKKRDEEMGAAIKKASEEIAATGKMAKETLDQLKQLSEGATALQTRMLDVEQKFIASQNDGRQRRDAGKSLGQRTVESDVVKKFMADKGGTAKFAVKAITSDTTGAGGAGDLVLPTRVAEIIRPEDRRMTIRDLLSQSRTASNAIEYVQETGFDNQADVVAEGAEKPESSIDFQLRNVPVRTIAHWIPVTKQIYDDAPMLASYIDNRLRFGLATVEEAQLLTGDGTGQNLLGLIPEAAVFNRQNTGTKLDVIRRAITQVRLSEFRADAVVLHPGDWEEMELVKTDFGSYVWANPMGLLNPTVWGLRVVDTTAMEEAQFLVGAFRQAATVWDREDANVQISEHDRDNFIKNMLTVRGEERIALTVFRPEAMVTGEFAESLTSG